MIGFLYLAVILCGLAGMSIIDWKYKLAFFYDYKRTFITLASTVLLFVCWDIIAIEIGIFINGTSRYVTGITLGQQFPIEEIFFLTLLCYMPLIIYRKFSK